MALIIALGLLYFTLRSIYYLFFHPLSRFPGDKLAAVTTKYAFYHDVVRPGMYWRVVEEMHHNHGKLWDYLEDFLAQSYARTYCENSP